MGIAGANKCDRLGGSAGMADKVFTHLLQVGDVMDPLEFSVTPELNQQYLYSEEDYNPRYIEGDGSGGAIVHPGLLLNMSNRTRSPSFYLAPGWAAIHASEETKFINPGRVGKKFKVTWKVAAAYEKRGRTWQAIDTLMVDEDGTEILRRTMHSTFASPEVGKK